jgi:hypothetical protein
LALNKLCLDSNELNSIALIRTRKNAITISRCHCVSRFAKFEKKEAVKLGFRGALTNNGYAQKTMVIPGIKRKEVILLGSLMTALMINSVLFFYVITNTLEI